MQIRRGDIITLTFHTLFSQQNTRHSNPPGAAAALAINDRAGATLPAHPVPSQGRLRLGDKRGQPARNLCQFVLEPFKNYGKLFRGRGAKPSAYKRILHGIVLAEGEESLPGVFGVPPYRMSGSRIQRHDETHDDGTTRVTLRKAARAARDLSASVGHPGRARRRDRQEPRLPRDPPRPAHRPATAACHRAIKK